jgi:hypothetical protein
VLAVASSLHATVLLPADLGDLARESITIVRGLVVNVEAQWIDRRRIETVVTVDVERSLKGASGPTVQFRVPGGRVGRYRNVVVGAPEFAVGRRVIVFLGGANGGLPYTLGLGQGVFRIADVDGQPTVLPPAVLPVITVQPVVRGDPSRRPMSLGDFEARVRDLAVMPR